MPRPSAAAGGWPYPVTVAQDYYQRQVAKGISEKELMEWVVDMAHLLGWQTRHLHDSRAQNMSGLPDLLLWHEGQRMTIWAELKTEKGKLTTGHLTRRGKLVEGQAETIEALRACGQVVYVWRPSNWMDGTIQKVLAKRILKGER